MLCTAGMMYLAGSWAVGAWSNAQKGVLVHSGSESAANAASVGAPLTEGSEAEIIAAGGDSTEMTLQGTGM